jgi:L-ribulokinase
MNSLPAALRKSTKRWSDRARPLTFALAIAAAVAAGEAAGGHASFEAAQQKMTSLKEKRFTPDVAAQRVYDELYGMYRELHDAFGGLSVVHADLPSFMKRLLAIREREIGRRS